MIDRTFSNSNYYLNMKSPVKIFLNAFFKRVYGSIRKFLECYTPRNDHPKFKIILQSYVNDLLKYYYTKL